MKRDPYISEVELEVRRYKCPNCGRFTDEMKLLDMRYEPNQRELRKHPNVAGELLECKCGRVWRWSQLVVVFEKMKSGKEK